MFIITAHPIKDHFIWIVSRDKLCCIYKYNSIQIFIIIFLYNAEDKDLKLNQSINELII